MLRMRKWFIAVALAVATASCADARGGSHASASLQAAMPDTFGFGRTAAPAEIARLDTDITPDGGGLPPGSGSAASGAEVYRVKCAHCHGPTGNEGPYDELAGRVPGDSFPFGADPSVTTTIGNYWPYATTIYDYTNRAMPFDAPGSLTADEVYGVVAWLLWRNEIIGVDEVMNRETLPAVIMPARDRFVADDRKGGREIR